MQFRSGDRQRRRSRSADALALQPDLNLNPDYDTPDLRAAWDEAKGAGEALPRSRSRREISSTRRRPSRRPTPPCPSTWSIPAPSSCGSSSSTGRPDEGMGEPRAEAGRKAVGGVIPCGKVTARQRALLDPRVRSRGRGERHARVTPSARSRCPSATRSTSEAPHLPNRPTPQQCEENEEPPEHAGAEEKEKRRPLTSPASEGAGGEYARWWIGVAGAVDLISLSGGNDLCGLTASAAPANTQGYYCTNPDGSDFPSRASSTQARSLIPGQAGNVSGGIQAGDLRVMVAVDYALSPEMLIGARVGYLYNSYTGTRRGHRAPRLRIERARRGARDLRVRPRAAASNGLRADGLHRARRVRVRRAHAGLRDHPERHHFERSSR